MANRLPIVGSDDGTWGTVLNTFLSTEHNSADGTHNMASAGLVTEIVNTVASSGTAQTLVAPTTATLHHVTLTGNCAITLPAAVAGRSFTLLLKQDSVGSRTVTWTTAKWAGGVAPTLTTTAAAVDILVFICIDGTNWLGFVSGLDMK